MNLPNHWDNWPLIWHELWAERAAIIEYEDKQPRTIAERLAEKDIRGLAAKE